MNNNSAARKRYRDISHLGCHECQQLVDAATALEVERDELRAEADRLRELIRRDGTGLANAIDTIRKTLRGYQWLGEPDVWGSYSYEEQTEETLRREMAFMLDEVEKIARDAMLESGDRVNAAFRSDRDLVKNAECERDEARAALDAMTVRLARVRVTAKGRFFNREWSDVYKDGYAHAMTHILEELDADVEAVRVVDGEMGGSYAGGVYSIQLNDSDVEPGTPVRVLIPIEEVEDDKR